ncbi:DoxX family protein [Flexivirga alba]|uniref:DoxX family protein n=1 Tax=Flexivirga alba TaxID=702742 RepID=A0ABW2AFR2_9MICO
MYDTIVWIIEALLAAFFLAAGVPKLLGAVSDRWAGFDQLPRGMTVLIGASEVAAGIGLVAPLVFDTAQWLTPLAGLGIAVISLMASGFHVRQQEWLAALETALWAALAGAVVAARWGEFAGGPALSRHEVLPTVLIVLLLAVIANLMVLSRAAVEEKTPAGLDVVAEPGEAVH